MKRRDDDRQKTTPCELARETRRNTARLVAKIQAHLFKLASEQMEAQAVRNEMLWRQANLQQDIEREQPPKQ